MVPLPSLGSPHHLPPPPAEPPYDSAFCVLACLPQVPCKNRAGMRALLGVSPQPLTQPEVLPGAPTPLLPTSGSPSHRS